MLKKTFVLISTFLVGVLLVSCASPTQKSVLDKFDGYAFGLTHTDGHYLGVAYANVASVTTGGKKVVSLTMDGLYLPYAFEAKEDGIEESELEKSSIKVWIGDHGNAAEGWFAKTWTIGKTVFKASAAEGATEEAKLDPAKAVIYKSGDIDLLTWIATPANAKAYVDQADADYTKFLPKGFPVQDQYKAGLRKSETGYSAGSGSYSWTIMVSGIVTNLQFATIGADGKVTVKGVEYSDAVLAAAKTAKASAGDPKYAYDGVGNTWKIGSYDTGVTASDTIDYFYVGLHAIQAAAGNGGASSNFFRK